MHMAMRAALSRPPAPTSLSQSARDLGRNLARTPFHILEAVSEYKPPIESVRVVASHVAQPVQITAVSDRSVELRDNVIRLVVVHVLVFGSRSSSNRVLAPPTRQPMCPFDADEIAVL